MAMTENENAPVENVEGEYSVNQDDLQSFKKSISDINQYTLQRGRLRTEYMSNDRRIERFLESAVEQQNMLASIMRQKVNAPATHVLDLDKGAFVPPPEFGGGK